MDAKTSKLPLSFAARAREDKARKILQRLFRDYPGSFSVQIGHADTIAIGQTPPEFTVVFNRLRALRNLILSTDPVRHADAYFKGWLDLEGDIFAALKMKDFLPSLKLSPAEKFSLLLDALVLSGEVAIESGGDISRSWSKPLTMPKHSKSMNKEAIGFHYDVSNDFYRLWLDEKMVYSCAYFENAHDSLEDAQSNKLDLICRKLCLKPGERLLDIGCGWGALVMWAARRYGVKAHGVTLSENQYAYAKERIREAGLEQQITVELKDYRDIEGAGVFDKICSVGMFEHVGIRNLPVYFSTVHRLLKRDGLFLNHGITQDEDAGTITVANRLITHYVFPDGELDMVSNILNGMERCQFEIHDVESLRPHYAMTLRQWVKRLEAHHEQALKVVPETVYRIWRVYMAGFALQFENGAAGVYQILAAKRQPQLLNLPLTRSFITQKEK